jgi:hypothetical protein
MRVATAGLAWTQHARQARNKLCGEGTGGLYQIHTHNKYTHAHSLTHLTYEYMQMNTKIPSMVILHIAHIHTYRSYTHTYIHADACTRKDIHACKDT